MASLTKSQSQLLEIPGALDAFRRKWEYLWVYAEVGYARAYTSMHHFTFTRPVRFIGKMIQSLTNDRHRSLSPLTNVAGAASL